MIRTSTPEGPSDHPLLWRGGADETTGDRKDSERRGLAPLGLGEPPGWSRWKRQDSGAKPRRSPSDKTAGLNPAARQDAAGYMSSSSSRKESRSRRVASRSNSRYFTSRCS